MSGTFCAQHPSGRPGKRFLTPFLALMIAVIAGAAALRLVSLDNRLMHCDEAVQAEKLRLLLEDGYYKYDPEDYHGPTLNYLTLPIAWLAGAEKLTAVTETHLRLLPAIFGILLVALVWPLRDELGRPAAFCAAVLTAVSPAMVFYSRYYIHEMLLVGFTFAAMVALWRCAGCKKGDRSNLPERPAGCCAQKVPDTFSTFSRPWLRQGLWLVLFGLCVGMMHASKETCVIPLFAMALAAVLTMRGRKGAGTFCLKGPSGAAHKRFLSPFFWPGLVVLLSAASISTLLFSSFLDNPQGVVDSYTTYSHYFSRAAGEGTAGPHDKPWYHYFQRLFWWHPESGPLWTEASIAALALVGLAAAAVGKGVKPANLAITRFLAVFTLVMIVVYSALPYKTPWCAAGFLHGMILLAGVGAVVLVRAAPHIALKAVAIVLLAAGVGHLAWQAYTASFLACDDPDNPYVYAQTSADVPLLARAVEQIANIYAEFVDSDPDFAASDPDAKASDPHAMHILVICPDHDYWPLPWYLRRFRWVWRFDEVPDPEQPNSPPNAPLIITKPEMEGAAVDYAYAKHVPGQPIARQRLKKQGDAGWQLRPGVWLRVNVWYDLGEEYRADQEE